MSASREKKARQERGADYLSPKQKKALEEQKATRRVTTIFSVCAALFVLCLAALLVWNSNIIQRNADAVRINGQTYTAADVAYYYYNVRSNLMNNSTSYGIDTSKSLRDQTYTDGTRTWYDYLVETSVQSLASAALTAQAAQEAGFDGRAELESTVSESFSSLVSSATGSGYTVSQYLKAAYGPLMTRDVFERNLRMVTLADAYTTSLAGATNFSDAELTAAYHADPNAYSIASYESAIFSASSFASEASEGTDAAEADDGTAAAKEAAEAALERYKAGEALEAVAEDANASYTTSNAYYSTSSEIAEWLFDDARKEGDAAVLDYTYYGYTMGSIVVVFHGKERADFHTVSVRHILVEDEATADAILSQYNAGDRTEESFATLAQANSTDNADAGGLYENVYIGQMVKPFEDWCFDSSRRSGDTGVVQTDYGYHVMYFVGASDTPYWQDLAAVNLANERISAITENVDSELLSGMKYIDR